MSSHIRLHITYGSFTSSASSVWKSWGMQRIYYYPYCAEKHQAFTLIQFNISVSQNHRKKIARRELWTSFGAHPCPATMANFEIRANFKVNSLFSGYFKHFYRDKYHHSFPPLNWCVKYSWEKIISQYHTSLEQIIDFHVPWKVIEIFLEN